MGVATIYLSTMTPEQLKFVLQAKLGSETHKYEGYELVLFATSEDKTFLFPRQYIYTHKLALLQAQKYECTKRLIALFGNRTWIEDRMVEFTAKVGNIKPKTSQSPTNLS